MDRRRKPLVLDRYGHVMATEAYKGAARRRDPGERWVATSGDADTDTLLDLATLRQRSRDLLRNNPIAVAAITAKVANVVGSNGLMLTSSIDSEYLKLTDQEADDWESKAEAEWRLFSESSSCDLRRTLNFAGQQELAFRSLLENGDHFVSMVTLQEPRPGWPFSFALQHIEADRVSNPNGISDTETMIAGVEKDVFGAPLQYHVCNVHPGALLHVPIQRKWTTMPAFGRETGRRITLHLYRVLRDGQTRGVPDLSPVMEVLKQLDKYIDAEVDRSVKSALFLAFVTTQDGEGLHDLTTDQLSDVRKMYYDTFAKEAVLGHSSVVNLFPGDNIAFSDPKAPNSAAETFLFTFVKLVAGALELPYEVLLRYFQGSYSAARGALLMAWQSFLRQRAFLARELCIPVYEAVLSDAISAGRLNAPGFFSDPLRRQAWLGCEWVGDAPLYIDENKAVTAAVDRINAGLSTHRGECAGLTGKNYDRVRRQLAKEQRNAPPTPASPGPTQSQQRTPPPSAEDLNRADRQEQEHDD